MHLELLHAALFNGAPPLGTTDTSKEVTYDGYKRCLTVVDSTSNVTPIEFPICQGGFTWATHIALIDGRGVIIGSRTLAKKDVT